MKKYLKGILAALLATVLAFSVSTLAMAQSPSGQSFWFQATSTILKTVKQYGLTIGEIAAPATPASGYGSIYFKTDGKLYSKNDAGTEVELGAGGGGGGAPTDATYITQTANASLSAEQALSALSTGIVKNTTGTGVLSIAASGTDYAPATSGTSILKGNGSGGFSSAVSNTDYLPVASPTFTGTLTGDNIQTSGSSGVAIKNSGGTTVLTVGAAAGTGVTAAGQLNANALQATTTVAALTTMSTGAAAGTTGKVNFVGTTSGTVGLSVADAAGTWTMKLPTTAGTSGYFLQTDGSGNTTWAAASGGLSWNATATGTSGTGLALTVGNSASASTIGQSITIGNTQAERAIGLLVDTGSSATGQTGIEIRNLRSGSSVAQGAFLVNAYGSATQALATGFGYVAGTNYNTNSSADYYQTYFVNEQNAGAGINSGFYITNKSTEVSLAASQGAGLGISQTGVGGSAILVSTASNINSSTNGLVNYTLSNTQSGATVMQKIDTGTSAQGHTGLLVNLFNASSSARGILIDGSSTGSGDGIYISSSAAGFRGMTIEAYGAAGTSGKGVRILTNSTTAQTGGLFSAQINTGVTNPSVVYRADAQTSAQAHTLYLANAAGANTGQLAFSATLSSTGTGIAYHATSSALSGAGRLQSLIHSASGTLTANTTDQSTIQSSRTYTNTSGSVTDNYNVQYLSRTNITTGAGGTLLAQGSVLQLENVATQTAGTLTDSVAVLKLTQDTDSTGDIISALEGATEVFAVEDEGHIYTGGGDPVLSACGTTPAVVGSDTAGKITIGGGGATTSCTVTFAVAYTTNAPACVITGDNTAVTYAATTTTSVLTVTSSADMQSDVISYVCYAI